MKITILDKDVDCLIELLYLGNWMANSAKRKETTCQKYEEFYQIIRQMAGNKQFDEEEIHDRLTGIIEFYDKSILYSEFARQYADYKYPYNLAELKKENDEILEQYAANFVLKDACETELKVNRFKNIKIKLPNLQNKIKQKIESLKNNI